MTTHEFDLICIKALEKVRMTAPIDTGNLRYNAIFGYYKDANTFVIEVSGEPPNIGIAPYMPYTNEKWISPKWNGKQNPNEGWWEKAAKEVAEMIAFEIYKGANLKIGEEK